MQNQGEIPFSQVQGWISSTPSTLSIHATSHNVLTVTLQTNENYIYVEEPMVFCWRWNFGAYVNGLKSTFRQQAINCILQLVGAAARIGITQWTIDSMPKELMTAFSKCWISLMGVGDTGFLTETFKHRLRDLALRAWRYAKNYARFDKQAFSGLLYNDELVIAINC